MWFKGEDVCNACCLASVREELLTCDAEDRDVLLRELAICEEQLRLW